MYSRCLNRFRKVTQFYSFYFDTKIDLLFAFKSYHENFTEIKKKNETKLFLALEIYCFWIIMFSGQGQEPGSSICYSVLPRQTIFHVQHFVCVDKNFFTWRKLMTAIIDRIKHTHDISTVLSKIISISESHADYKQKFKHIDLQIVISFFLTCV